MRFSAVVAPVALLVAACSPPATTEPSVPVVRMAEATRMEMDRVNASRFTAILPPTPVENVAPQAPAADEAAMAAEPEAPRYDAGLVRIQVLLDRAHFSPGVIDGHDGENVRKAVAAYQESNGLPVNGLADEILLSQLEGRDSSPALVSYVLTQQDVAGPYVTVPESMSAQSRLSYLGYGGAIEMLAERFHMSEVLLRALNPSTDFAQANVEIVVANAGGELGEMAASIEIDASAQTLRAYDAFGRLLAFYPATVGSSENPAPRGELEVRAVAFDPTYNYDADSLPSFNDRSGRSFTIAAGPNNPVGSVWIALSRQSYGIHGTPNPSLISKTESHGCVRLTNWDALELGRAVQPGTPVIIRESAVAERATRAG